MPFVLLPLATLALAAWVTWLAIHYAIRRRLVDLPGERRSHQVTTPRGGGVGLVASQVFACVVLAFLYPAYAFALLVFAVGLLLVAGIGWWDDHRPLPALPRLGVHLLASLMLGGVVLVATGDPLKAAFCAFLAVSLINIWNFMDGINGLAASQAALVGIGVAVLLPWPLGIAGAVLAAGCLGFLPFNFPRARIFMGDVGSGALGYLVAGLLALGMCTTVLAPPLWLVLPSVFLVDAGFTLLARILKGERWMQPHTQHLYQRFVKRGRSHAIVTVMYASLTLSGVVFTVFFSSLPLVWGWAGGLGWGAALAAAWGFLRIGLFNKDGD